jgi:hypothetical protein
MALLPAVYVTIEDQSFALPNPSTGRYGLVIVLTDRGPHNRVLEINSQTDFYLTYGRPNIDRTGQAHYMADKFLQYSNRLLVVRPVLMDSTIESENAAISNIYIKYNAESGSTEVVTGDAADAFTFTQNLDVVITSEEGYKKFDINEYIYSNVDQPYTVDINGTRIPNYRRIISKTINEGGFYQFTLDSNYPGTSSSSELINRYFPGTNLLTADPEFTFTYNSNIVVVATVDIFNAVNLKDWIYPSDLAFDGSLSRQVVDKYIDTTLPNNPVFQLIVDSPFLGSTIVSGAIKYTLFEIDSIPQLKNPDGGEPTLEITDPDNIWYFYATGAGSFYNNLYFMGVRNIEYEKTYTTTGDSAEAIYKYAFMDLYLYQQNIDGNSTLLEGPWTVSLIRNTANGEIVRDIYTGRELYIESVINFNSSFIRCESSLGAEVLLTNPAAELLRLSVLSLFSNEKVYRTNVLGFNGIMLGKGDDGIQYDSRDKLNIAHPKIIGLVQRVFATQLISSDGSIENLPNTLYPQFNIDYIISGGYNADIQNAARELADIRQDCMVLADTGTNNVSAAQDIVSRNLDVPWNTWNAMIYTQYQNIFDPFTGKHIWMSPVFHAIERHLFCDNFYWIAEPVAGIEKGAISAPIKLAYRPNIAKMEDLIEVGLNPVIVEPDGVYILTQFTAWKRLSIMRRGHAVKFIHFVRKNLPKLLKDILQRKMTSFWVNLANQRINAFLAKYVDGANGASERYTALTSFNVIVTPDEVRSELNIMLTLHPIRAIESINVHIIVT